MKTILTFLFFAISIVNAQIIIALDSTDFVVARIKDDLDSNAVKTLLGKPTSISQSENPFDIETKIVCWHYPGLIINLGSGNSTCGVTITSEKYSTKRGLCIGDTIERVMMLYGKPDSQYEDRINYLVPDTELHAIQIRLSNGKVTEIFLGWFLD
jgi:hypothetical protein